MSSTTATSRPTVRCGALIVLTAALLVALGTGMASAEQHEVTDITEIGEPLSGSAPPATADLEQPAPADPAEQPDSQEPSEEIVDVTPDTTTRRIPGTTDTSSTVIERPLAPETTGAPEAAEPPPARITPVIATAPTRPATASAAAPAAPATSAAPSTGVPAAAAPATVEESRLPPARITVDRMTPAMDGIEDSEASSGDSAVAAASPEDGLTEVAGTQLERADFDSGALGGQEADAVLARGLDDGGLGALVGGSVPVKASIGLLVVLAGWLLVRQRRRVGAAG
jgi:hypothetical protein